MPSDVGLLVIALGLLMVAGVFVAAEAAFSTVSKSRAEELHKEHHSRGSQRLLDVIPDRARYVNTSILMHILCSTTTITLVAEVLLTRWNRLGGWSVVAIVALMSAVVFVFLGVAPRTVGRQHSGRVAMVMAGPVRLLSIGFGVLTRLMIMLGNAITPGKGYRQGPFSTQAELRELVEIAEADRLIEDSEAQMIQSVFELGDTLVREVMVPRTEMVWIEASKTLRQGMSLCLRSGFSRIPVVGEGPDDIVGVVYIKDMAKRFYEHRESEQSERISSIMRKPFFVPDSLLVDDLLRELRVQRVHMAIAVDEYGGTAGLVTIEDVLEEIVGEIVDEYDGDERPEVEALGHGNYRISARMHVEDAGNLLGFDIDSEAEGVDSVGGLLAKRLGKVPISGSRIEIGDWTLTAENPEGRRRQITTVLAVRTNEESEPEAVEQSSGGEVA